MVSKSDMFVEYLVKLFLVAVRDNKDKFTIALTGIVLVKKKYALANADDLTKIPRSILRMDSKAMFIPEESEKPWFCKVKSYIAHPEYEYATLNTIALVELDPGEDQYFPMNPICWPKNEFNTSNELYAVGFVDDNQILEKSFYSLKYVEKNFCQEFYSRAGLTDDKLTPTHYQCGFAKNNKEDCVWDNGMVLASNSTKHWTMVGFGVRGPGCAAPARFIDLLTYLPWVETATGGDEIDDYGDYSYRDQRRSAHAEGTIKKVRSRIASDLVSSWGTEKYQWLRGAKSNQTTNTAKAKYSQLEAMHADHTRPKTTVTSKSNNTKPEVIVTTITNNTTPEDTFTIKADNTRPDILDTTITDNTGPEILDTTVTDNTRPEILGTTITNNTVPKDTVTIKADNTRPEILNITITDNTRTEILDTTITNNTISKYTVTIKADNTRPDILDTTITDNNIPKILDTTITNNTVPKDTVMIKADNTSPEILNITIKDKTRTKILGTTITNNTVPKDKVTIKAIKADNTRPEAVTEAYRINFYEESVLVNFSSKSSICFVHVVCILLVWFL